MTDLKRLADVAEHVSCNELNKNTADAMGELATLLRSAARADAERFSSAINIAAVEAERDEIAAAGRDVVQDAERIMHEFGIHKEQQEQLVADARAERDAARGQLEEIHNILDWFCVPRQYPNSIGELATLRERLMTLTNDRYSHDRLSEMLSGGGVPTICHDCNGGAVAAPIEMRVRMLIGERDAARNDAAWWKDSLREVCNHVLGHEKWNPDDRTIGTPIVLAAADAVKRRDELQRLVNRAHHLSTHPLRCGELFDEIIDLLEPHATPASPVAKPATVPTHCCTDCDPAFRKAYGLDESEAKPDRHAPLNFPSDRTKMIERACAVDDSTCSTCSPEIRTMLEDGVGHILGVQLRKDVATDIVVEVWTKDGCYEAIREYVGKDCPPIDHHWNNNHLPRESRLFGKSVGSTTNEAVPPRQWTSTPPADRSGKWWNAWSHSENNNGCVMVEERCSWDTCTKPELRGTVYDLWLPYVEGDTRDNLPPLPTTATPQVSPVGSDDTRELVARLAEAISKNVIADRTQREDQWAFTDELDAIIAAARKEPADAQQ